MSDISIRTPFDLGTDFASEAVSFTGISRITTSLQNGAFAFTRPFSVRLIKTYAINELEIGAAENLSMAEEIVQVSKSAEKLALEKTILGFLDGDYLDDSEAEQQLTEAVPEALVFLNELPPQAPLPIASLAADGIITLEWNEDNKKAAAMFEGEEDYGYTYFNGDRYIPGETTGVAGAGIPQDLNMYLTK
ncbi:hypothetical protein [Burkholderia sp. WSM2230]|uniref:hypothetical protein n=1 Tax=Burkholderia sp. WSM2230 TaxID=944435 RepID=UPI00046E845B|nr:hypothetical protein [Burkholderia sp. WSM2230]